MRKCAVLLATAFFALAPAWSALASVTMTRTVAELDPDGFFVPGTTTLNITESFSTNESGITAFGITDNLPAGFTFGAITGAVDPPIKPGAGATGAISFAFISTPSLPFSLSYTVNVPASPTLPATMTGSVEYRTSGASLFSTDGTCVQNDPPSTNICPTTTVFQVKPTTLTLTRTIDPASTGLFAGAPGYYVPGGFLDITVSVSKDGPEGVTAFGYSDDVPATWTFDSVTAPTAAENPAIKPNAGDADLLEFSYIQIPPFPLSFTYRVNIPANATGPATLDGVVEYRLTGGALFTPHDMVTLNPVPCLSFDRPLPGGAANYSYAPDSDVTINVSIDGSACGTVTAMGMVENTPPGWTFKSVSGAAGPTILPAVNSTGPLNFGWIVTPGFPANFSYVLHTPAGESGDKSINGQVLYRLGGGELQSIPVTTTIKGDTPPVITLVGGNVTLQCGDTFTEPGYDAQDIPDGDITANVVVGGTVDPTTPGVYTLTYDVTDSTNNTDHKERVVTVEDTAVPVITLNGSATETINCGSSYIEDGATADDACDGDISGAIAITGTVNTAVVGTYTLSYDVSDGANNAAVTVTRTVEVVDVLPPLITLNGAASVTIACGSAYNEAGATAADACEGSTVVNISGAVNTAVPGVYTVSYNSTDSATVPNAAATVTRTVNVVDTTPPVVTLNSNNAVNVECHGTYNEQGATANDVCDGAVTVSVSGSVDVNTVGTYTLTYSATDANNNTGTATRIVTVSDSTAPVITLNGQATSTIECGIPFTDPGATASDACDANVPVSSTGTVGTAPGTYTITYNASDDAGNGATPVTRTVTVADSIAPTITLNGAATSTIECGGSFTDPGATASDVCDSSVSVTVSGSVNAGAAGTYTLTYSASDDTGNAATPVTRTVTVADNTAPDITINGGNTRTVECHGTFSDPGATATDACDGSVLVTPSGNVDVNTPGTYTISYNAADAAGNNAATATLTVTVEDTTDPVVTLNGAASSTIECGTAFTDAGATAADACDGDLSGEITVVGSVGATPGTYTLTYSARDDEGNTGSATRTVTVADSIDPVVTLNGAAAIELQLNDTFTDPGATATDSCSGDVTSSIAVTGSVNTTVAGVYTLTYTATDGAGNTGSATRTVTVLAPQCVINSIALTSPTADIKTAPACGGTARSVRFPMTSAVVLNGDAACGTDALTVVYTINGVAAGVSDDAAGGFPISASRPVGSYTIVATASLASGGTQSTTFTLNIVEGVDTNCDGICDNPFECIGPDEDWDAQVPSVNCDKHVRMLSWTGDGAGGTITVDLANPEDESQSASIRIPRNVLAPGERGILIFSIACDLVSLLGTDVAAATGDISADRPSGFAYFEISILVSSDGGASFAELDNEVVADLPIEIALNGLTFTPGQAQTFSSHTTGVSPTDSSITAEEGSWSSNSIFGAVGSGGSVSASTSALSVFVPVENNPLGPTLSVEPNPGYDQLFGIVKLNQTVTDTVVIKNVGSGTVTGTATLTDPANVFGVVGTTSYTLKEDESATLTVSFTPDAEGDFTGTLTLSGAVNSPINVTLKGTGSTQVKNISLFGCAPGAGGTGNAWGDAAVALLALGALALGTQMHRRTRRQN